MTTVEIEYCVPCGLRDNALDTASAVLTEFGQELDGVTLTPGHGGVFKVYTGGEVVFDKDEHGYQIETITDAIATHVQATARANGE